MKINIRRPVRSFLSERQRHTREEERVQEEKDRTIPIAPEPILKIYLAKKDDNGGWKTLFALRTIPGTLDGEDLGPGEYATLLKENGRIKAFLKKYKISAKNALEFAPMPVFI